MRSLQERIRNAEARRDAAEEGSEERRIAEAELGALRALEPEVQQEINSITTNRAGEGRQAGERQAREALAQSMGVSVEELDATAQAYAEQRRNEQSEAERARADAQAREQERDQANQRAEQAERRWRDSIRREAVRDALISGGLRPDRATVALRVADLDSVDVSDEGQVGDASAVVAAVREAEPAWFNAPPPERQVPDPPATQRRRERQGQSAASRQNQRYRRPGQ